MLPLPPNDFEPAVWTTGKVSADVVSTRSASSAGSPFEENSSLAVAVS